MATKFNARLGLSVGSPAISIIDSTGNITSPTITGNVNFAPLGTSTSFGSPFSSPQVTLQLSKCIGGVTTTSGFRMQAQYDPAANNNVLLYDNPDAVSDYNIIKYSMQNTQLQVLNTNDSMGLQYMSTYGTGYIGIVNTGGAAGVLPANTYRNFFAIQRSDGAVGSVTPTQVDSPKFTNKLDDGSGNLIVGGDATTINTTRYLKVAHTTPSTSTTTGALQVAGGAGIAGALNVGSNSTFNGVVVGKGTANIASNLAVGQSCMTNASTTGVGNVGIGYTGTLSGLTTGTYNMALGGNGLAALTTGTENVAMGVSAVEQITTGSYNTGVGAQAIRNVFAGNNNVGIGKSAGTSRVGPAVMYETSNGVYIGAFCLGLADYETNAIVIGASAVGLGSNSTVIGTSSTTKTKLFGALDTTGDITVKAGSTTGSATITTPTTELVLTQTGDQFGASTLRLQNRNGVNGAMFDCSAASVALVDFVFKTANGQRNIRLETRGGELAYTGGDGYEFQIGNFVGDNPEFVIGRTQTFIRATTASTSTTTGALRVAGGAGIAGNLYVGGNLVVNGSTTTINSNTVSVDDKNIELGGVVSTSPTGTVTAGSAVITALTSTANIIPGSAVTALTGAGTITLPAGTTVASIDSATQITLSSALTGTGGPTTLVTLTITGATDVTANGGGITLKGTTDKTLTWSSLGWTSSEDFNLASGKVYEINGTTVLSGTTLGSGVTASSLTSVGTIATGTWQGTQIGVAYGGTGTSTALTTGSVVFAGASGAYSQNNAKLFWDNTNTRLGIGTASPSSVLHISSATNSSLLRLEQTGANNQATINFSTTGGTAEYALDQSGNVVFRTQQSGLYFDNFGSGNIYFRTNGTNIRMGIDSGGSVSINNLTASQAVFTDQYKNLISVATTGSGSVVLSSTSAPTSAIVGISDTQTLSSKRITSRTTSITGASGGSITPTSDNSDQYNITALGATATFLAPSGTPTDGQKLSIRIYSAAAQTISWTITSNGYRVIGTTLPTTTGIGKTIYVGCVWNAADSFWDVVAVAIQA